MVHHSFFLFKSSIHSANIVALLALPPGPTTPRPMLVISAGLHLQFAFLLPLFFYATDPNRLMKICLTIKRPITIFYARSEGLDGRLVVSLRGTPDASSPSSPPPPSLPPLRPVLGAQMHLSAIWGVGRLVLLCMFYESKINLCICDLLLLCRIKRYWRLMRHYSNSRIIAAPRAVASTGGCSVAALALSCSSGEYDDEYAAAAAVSWLLLLLPLTGTTLLLLSIWS